MTQRSCGANRGVSVSHTQQYTTKSVVLVVEAACTDTVLALLRHTVFVVLMHVGLEHTSSDLAWLGPLVGRT